MYLVKNKFNNHILDIGGIMKKNCTLCFLLCAVMLLSMTGGCGNDSNTGNESTDNNQSVTQMSDESSKIPADVQKKLDEALNAEPISILAEEWTVDTICDATYINGKKLSLPFTIKDLGAGFEVMEDTGLEPFYNENKEFVIGYISYYGNKVGSFSIFNCNDIEKMRDFPLTSLEFTYEDGNEATFPVSLNGVSIGADADFMKERLYFMERSDDFGNDDETFCYQFINDDFESKCFCMNNKVYDISFKLREKGE